MNFISDKELMRMPIKDNGEKLVSIEKICPTIRMGIAQYIVRMGEKYVDLAKQVREEAALKLCKAESYLPKGCHLLIICGFRPLDLQKKEYLAMFNKVKKENPDWDDKKVKEETDMRVAPVEIVPPHSTGGAIDLSIVDENGKELCTGTNVDEFTEKTPIDSKKLSSEERENRKMFSQAMTKAGFINYPPEWWHWSYGDRYWAAASKKKYSIYKGL